MSKFAEECWERAVTAVKEQFEIERFLPEQENSLREFLEGGNVFVNLLSGFGKSLIFPVSSGRFRCSAGQASWLQCDGRDFTSSLADGRSS